MTELTEAGLQATRHEVQRMLGACLLGLQVYERGLKAILAHSEVSGLADQLDAARAARVGETARMTLGQLIGQLLGTYVVIGESDSKDERRDAETAEGIWFSTRFQTGLSPDIYARTEVALRELVELRNRLVHHFFDDHDLLSEMGCQLALERLTAARDRIGHHIDELAQWAKDLDAIRQHVADYMRSDQFRDFVVDGIAPDGTVHWPIAGIVDALREAAAELAEEGWTRLDRATAWIATRSPHQLPERYGCRSWPQVLDKSRAFDLRYHEDDGQRIARYRLRERDLAP